MMFFRGKQPDGSVWKRFRASMDGFTFVHEDDYYAAHVVANAERVVDLFYVLSEQLSPAVDLVIDDKRAGLVWKGDALALPDVRDTLARLKVLLAQHGGVEVSVHTADDQLTLNPYLELFIYARTDRWLYMLEGKGLQEQRMVRTKSWKVKRDDFPAAPELDNAIAAAVERLRLVTA
jgi:hypothetical protein